VGRDLRIRSRLVRFLTAVDALVEGVSSQERAWLPAIFDKLTVKFKPILFEQLLMSGAT